MSPGKMSTISSEDINMAPGQLIINLSKAVT